MVLHDNCHVFFVDKPHRLSMSRNLDHFTCTALQSISDKIFVSYTNKWKTVFGGPERTLLMHHNNTLPTMFRLDAWLIDLFNASWNTCQCSGWSETCRYSELQHMTKSATWNRPFLSRMSASFPSVATPISVSYFRRTISSMSLVWSRTSKLAEVMNWISPISTMELSFPSIERIPSQCWRKAAWEPLLCPPHSMHSHSILEWRFYGHALSYMDV